MMPPYAVFVAFLLFNAVALLCTLGPWPEAWRAAGLVFFVLEAGLAVVLGVPIYLHHLVRGGKGPVEALAATLETILELVMGLV